MQNGLLQFHYETEKQLGYDCQQFFFCEYAIKCFQLVLKMKSFQYIFVN